MNDLTINLLSDDPSVAEEAAVLRKRPYIAVKGPNRGHSVIAVNTGRLDNEGLPVYAEQRIHTNATLRKDEWIQLESGILAAARRRLPIVEMLRAKGLAVSVGGLGTLVSEWEAASKMTDATITMDGESKNPDKDRQEFSLAGVPVPVISKPFRIGTRVLEASRRRGGSLDTTQQLEAARSVARVSESMVINGANIGAANSAGTRYQVYGLLTFPGRATANINDWTSPLTTPEQIHTDLLGLAQVMETQERHYGPFEIIICPNAAYQFRRDFKAFGERSLSDRVLSEEIFSGIYVSDMMPDRSMCLLQAESDVIDLAVAADLTTVQWESGSGWSNHFQVYAAWAPRLKQDFDDYCGIMHATMVP